MASLLFRASKKGVLRNLWINGNLEYTNIASFVSSSHIATAASTSATKMKIDLSGIFPPITTPFNADETIAYDKLQQNMEKWNKIPFKGYVIQGSNGEHVHLRSDERVELVRRAAQLSVPGKLILAGAGCESTQDTIVMSTKMAEAGASAVLVMIPSFYKGLMSNEALVQHFTKVADVSPVPVVIYSVPGITGIDLAPDVVIQLSSHPNIAGVTDSGGDISKIAYMVHKTSGNNFQVLAGSASFLLASYTVGAVGGVLALANVFGEQCCNVEKLFQEGKMEDAKLLQQRLIGPNWAVTRRFGVPGLKYAMDMMGYYGGPNRSPLLPLSRQNGHLLKQVFKNEGLL